MTIRRIIDASYRSAVKALVMGTSPAALARARERAFVKSLVLEFQAAYTDDDIRVFSAYGQRNFRDFGSEKLLSDIAVGRIEESCASGRDTQNFLFVAALLWQIEIDLSREWRHAIYAVNRLNCGSAENKLLLAARLPRGEDDYLQTLRAPFAAGSGAAHVALIPHPAEWEASEDAPAVWSMTDGEWVEAS